MNYQVPLVFSSLNIAIFQGKILLAGKILPSVTMAVKRPIEVKTQLKFYRAKGIIISAKGLLFSI